MAQGDGPGSRRIDALWQDHVSLVEYLRARGEWTLSGRVEEEFAKTLTIAAASYFEVELTEAIAGLYANVLSESYELFEFVKRRAITRQYFQMFQWGSEGQPSTNANQFYGFFGSDFNRYMRERVREDAVLDNCVRAFLEIGNLRNYIVHSDYANVTLNRTAQEIYNLYLEAVPFIELVPRAVIEFSADSG